MHQNGQQYNNNSPTTIITTTTATSSTTPTKSKTKKYRRWLGIVAMLLALMLIVGSIYLHLRQKHHLGRLHLNHGSISSSPISSTTSITISNPSSSSSSSTTNGRDYDYSAIVHILPGMAADAPAASKGSSNEMIIDDYEYYEDDVVLKTPETTTSTVLLKSYPQKQKFLKPQSNISDACLQCICEATTECKPVECRGTPCGPFRISKPYWTDAATKGTTAATDYETCVNDFSCARSVVASYIHKYARDCTDDAIIDCRDHTALHILGPSGCMSKEAALLPIFEFRMSRCFIQQGIFFD